jgi:uncharacterized membrane protein
LFDIKVSLGFLQKKDRSFVLFNAESPGTFFNAINGKGQIVGSTMGEDVPPHRPGNGFLLQPDGTMTVLMVGPYSAFPSDINAAGVIVGNYFRGEIIDDLYSYGPSHVFIRKPNGTIRTMNTADDVAAVGINSMGTVVGRYREGNRNHGFLWESNQRKGTITPFDPAGSISTVPQAINASGRVVGCYDDGNMYHGFVRERNGAIVSFDVGSKFTCARKINAAGYIIGDYSDDNRVNHSFLRRPDGSTSSIAVGTFNTHLTGINEAGYIVGYYYDDDNFTTHGFLRRK